MPPALSLSLSSVSAFSRSASHHLSPQMYSIMDGGGRRGPNGGAGGGHHGGHGMLHPHGPFHHSPANQRTTAMQRQTAVQPAGKKHSVDLAGQPQSLFRVTPPGQEEEDKEEAAEAEAIRKAEEKELADKAKDIKRREQFMEKFTKEEIYGRRRASHTNKHTNTRLSAP